MNIIVVGMNHRTAPVGIRELFNIPQSEVSSVLHSLVGDGVIREVVILSTCNRVEIYAVCANSEAATSKIFDFLKHRSISKTINSKDFYVHKLPASVQHLYEVCSGLDSMVIGETEISGQVKDAYQLAYESHRTGLGFNKLFQSAFSVAKEIRSRTRIGMGSVSVGSVSVDLAGQIFGELTDRSVLLVGAGEMGETTARSLQSRGVQSLIVCNRTEDRAVELVKKLSGRVAPWENLYEECLSADIVISSTASSEPVITLERLTPVIERRNGIPLFLIDMAVPRDIEREISKLDGVYLYDMDDLQVIADKNLAERQKEIAVSKQIIRGHVDKYSLWFSENVGQIAKCPTARKMRKWLAEDQSDLATA